MSDLKKINMNDFPKLCSCMIIGSSLMLSACGGDSSDVIGHHESPTFTNNELYSYLKGTEWTLAAAYDGDNVVSELQNLGEKVTVSFGKANNEHSFGFSVGCNINGAGYSLSGDNLLSAEPVNSTAMFCQDLDNAENQLESFFRKNMKLSISNATGLSSLIMKTDDGRTLSWYPKNENNQSGENKALLQELKKYRWQLIESTDKNIQLNLDASSAVNSSFLSFANAEENELSYSMGCNNFTGGFTLGENTTLIASDVINTEKACNTTLMNAEKSLNQLMLQGSSLLIEGVGASTQTTTESTVLPTMTQTINNGANSNSTEKTIKWRGIEKTFTAQVEGQIYKRTAQGIDIIKEETQTFNNVSFPNPEFCDGLDNDNYGFLHTQFSNIFDKTCVYAEDSTIVYSVIAPDMDNRFSYKIKLTETTGY